MTSLDDAYDEEQNVVITRRLRFGRISLVPVDGATDKWHVPGREVATTAELIRRANLRGVTITLSKKSCYGSRTVLLN